MRITDWIRDQVHIKPLEYCAFNVRNTTFRWLIDHYLKVIDKEKFKVISNGFKGQYEGEPFKYDWTCRLMSRTQNNNLIIQIRRSSTGRTSDNKIKEK